jgi:HAD superfamily phosphatase (TIGR01668 family)
MRADSIFERWLSLLIPKRSVANVFEVTPEWLATRGIRGVMLDIDNTLTEWRSETLSAEILAWVVSLQKAGIKTCVVSNTHRKDRLKRLSDSIHSDFVFGVAKPGSRGFMLAMEKMGTTPEISAMIGDQIFTDVFGANRVGCLSIHMPPLSAHEFIGTRWISRRLERVLFWYLKRKNRLPAPGDDERP